MSGSAFPVIPPAINERGQQPDGYPLPDSGMTLRDWFAGQALAGLCADHTLDPPSADHIASLAYEAADAMLKARAR